MKNPGIVLAHNESVKITLRRESELKNYHLNVQSIFSKKEQLRKLVHDLGPNCSFWFTETWLCEFDDKNVCNLYKERYCCFRTDRISDGRIEYEKMWWSYNACGEGFFLKKFVMI